MTITNPKTRRTLWRVVLIGSVVLALAGVAGALTFGWSWGWAAITVLSALDAAVAIHVLRSSAGGAAPDTE